jgi:hypothetical protein
VTSPKYNALKARAQAEMAIFDALPSALRAAINACKSPPRIEVVRDALLRGVSEAKIIEVLQRSQSND